MPGSSLAGGFSDIINVISESQTYLIVTVERSFGRAASAIPRSHTACITAWLLFPQPDSWAITRIL